MRSAGPCQALQLATEARRESRSGAPVARVAGVVDGRAQGAVQMRLQALSEASTRTCQCKALDSLMQHSARVRQLQALAGISETPSVRRPAGAGDAGLPAPLKAGMESLSGMRMDHVRVHYNSAQPAQLNAHAFAQGSDIHVAPGQERHLPHEAWHVVQQAQGRVRPTMQLKAGVAVNDDAGLEREADVMGARALAHGVEGHASAATSQRSARHGMVIQANAHTEAWSAYTRDKDKKVNNVLLPANVRGQVNAKIQANMREAANRYRDVYISFGGNPIVISSPKALFHFSLDPTDEAYSGSHFTFETYNAAHWLHTPAAPLAGDVALEPANDWKSEAVEGVVNSAATNEQWLLERAGKKRGMLERLEAALEEKHGAALYADHDADEVDRVIAGLLAKRPTMRDLNKTSSEGGPDENPMDIYDVPAKTATDAHWRAAPADRILTAADTNPENISVVWGRMKTQIQARHLPNQLGDQIIAQTEFILKLGLEIYRALIDQKNFPLTSFQESKSNRHDNGHDDNLKEQAEAFIR
jgi:hypothetical protein